MHVLVSVTWRAGLDSTQHAPVHPTEETDTCPWALHRAGTQGRHRVRHLRPPTCGSLTKRSRQSTKLVPLKGSPPMPTTVDCPRPCAVVWNTACAHQRASMRAALVQGVQPRHAVCGAEHDCMCVVQSLTPAGKRCCCLPAPAPAAAPLPAAARAPAPAAASAAAPLPPAASAPAPAAAASTASHLVRQCARARHDANLARRVDVALHACMAALQARAGRQARHMRARTHACACTTDALQCGSWPA